MDFIGIDCENLITEYQKDLENYDKHKNQMKEIINKIENFDITTENKGEILLFDITIHIDIYNLCNTCKKVNIHFLDYKRCTNCL